MAVTHATCWCFCCRLVPPRDKGVIAEDSGDVPPAGLTDDAISKDVQVLVEYSLAAALFQLAGLLPVKCRPPQRLQVTSPAGVEADGAVAAGRVTGIGTAACSRGSAS